MQRTFRKYHRAIAFIISIPILLTVLSGILATFIREWGWSFGISSGALMKVHTGEIFHLESIYPVLNGVGLVGLVVTGLSMSGVFKRKKQKSISQ